MDYVSYFGVAIMVIALALTISRARRNKEKEFNIRDRMNFMLRPHKVIRFASIGCAVVFGLVLFILAVTSAYMENIPVLLLALAFTVISLFTLYYSFRWKLVVSDDELLLTPLFGRERKLSVKDVTHIETKNVNFTNVYNNEKKLFTAPGLSQGGAVLISYFIEKGVRAPSKIIWKDGNWF